MKLAFGKSKVSREDIERDAERELESLIASAESPPAIDWTVYGLPTDVPDPAVASADLGSRGAGDDHDANFDHQANLDPDAGFDVDLDTDLDPVRPDGNGQAKPKTRRTAGAKTKTARSASTRPRATKPTRARAKKPRAAKNSAT